MKKLIIFLALAIPLFASAQRQTGATNFTPQWNFKIVGADTIYQFGNTLTTPSNWPFIPTRAQNNALYKLRNDSTATDGYSSIGRLRSATMALYNKTFPTTPNANNMPLRWQDKTIYQSTIVINVKDYGADTLNTASQNTVAFAAAMTAASSPRARVYVPGGTYLLDSLIVPPGVRLEGASYNGTVLKTSATATKLVELKSSASMYNIQLRGNNPSVTYTSLSVIGTQTGVRLTGNNITIDNCYIIGFDKYGIEATTNGASTEGITISNTRSVVNYHSIYIPFSSQYGKFNNISSHNNYTGIYLVGGNNIFANCHFDNNVDGAYMPTGANDAHGTFVSSTFNHNSRYNLFTDGVVNGHKFDACYFYEGTIYIKNSIGINIANSHISVDSLLIGGGGQNQISYCTVDSAYGGKVVRNYLATDNSLLTNNRWLSGSSVNLSAINDVIPPITGTLVTESGAETLTNKNISGASNTFSNIPYSALTGTPTIPTQYWQRSGTIISPLTSGDYLTVTVAGPAYRAVAPSGASNPSYYYVEGRDASNAASVYYMGVNPIGTDGAWELSNAAGTQRLRFTQAGALSLPSTTTATTQSAGDNSTKVATTAYVDGGFVALTGNQTIAGTKTFSNEVVGAQGFLADTGYGFTGDYGSFAQNGTGNVLAGQNTSATGDGAYIAGGSTASSTHSALQVEDYAGSDIAKFFSDRINHSVPTSATGVAMAIRSITSSTTITNNDYTINVTSGTFSQALPATPITGQIYNIKNSGAGVVTVTATSIDGAGSVVINPTENYTFQYTGTSGTYIIL